MIFVLFPCLGHKKKNKNKNKTKLFHERTDLQKRVGWSGDFFFFFSILAAKMTLKNTKILEKKKDIFCWKILEKYSDLYSKFSAKFFRFLVKKRLILQDFGKIKKKIYQIGTFGSIVPIKQFFFFFSWPYWEKITNPLALQTCVQLTWLHIFLPLIFTKFTLYTTLQNCKWSRLS